MISVLEECQTYTQAKNRITKNVMDFAKSRFWPKQSVSNGLLASISKPSLSGTEALQRAKSLLFEDVMDLTDDLFSGGQLEHLDARTVEGVNRTLHVTRGRFTKSALAAVSGQEELPTLAELTVCGAHCGDHSTNHREAQDCLSRTREIAFILNLCGSSGR